MRRYLDPLQGQIEASNGQELGRIDCPTNAQQAAPISRWGTRGRSSSRRIYAVFIPDGSPDSRLDKLQSSDSAESHFLSGFYTGRLKCAIDRAIWPS